MCLKLYMTNAFSCRLSHLRWDNLYKLRPFAPQYELLWSSKTELLQCGIVHCTKHPPLVKIILWKFFADDYLIFRQSEWHPINIVTVLRRITLFMMFFFEQFFYLCGAVSLGLSGALGGSKILVWLAALLLAENSCRVVGRPGPSSPPPPPPTPSPFLSWDIVWIMTEIYGGEVSLILL